MPDSATSQVRAALLKGQAFSASEVADRWGKSSALLYSVTKALKAEGHDVISERGDDGVSRMRVVAGNGNGKGKPAKKVAAAKDSARTVTAPTAARKPKPRRRTAALTLGDTLTVVGLFLDDEGQVISELCDDAGNRYEMVVETVV